MQHVKDDETCDLQEEDPLGAQHLDARHVAVELPAHREALLEEEVRQEVEALVAPHHAGEHVFGLQDEEVLAAADLAEIQQLQRVDEDVAEIMQLHMRRRPHADEENEEAEVVVAVVSDVCTSQRLYAPTAQTERRDVVDEQLVVIFLALVHEHVAVRLEQPESLRVRQGRAASRSA